MATYDELNKENKSIYRYTLTFKTSWELHTAVQEVASQKGNNISDTCRDLLALGIENYNKEPGQFERHRLRLYRDIRKVRDRQHAIAILSELKGELSDEALLAHCNTFGVDPDELGPPRGVRKKRDRNKNFLRILFTDRQEGLPVNRVLEIAKREGFGENMTREVAAEMGLEQVWNNEGSVRLSVWKPTLE